MLRRLVYLVVAGTAFLAGVTVMMLTSDARMGDKARSQELGMAGYLVKPVKRADLFESVMAALGSESHESVKDFRLTPLPMRSHLRPLRILIAEDTPDNQTLLRLYLKGSPHQLQIVEDGEDLHLHRRVERRGGLVCDEQVGIGSEHHRDHHPLPHPAGELVGIGVVDPLGIADADGTQHLERAIAGLRTRRPLVRAIRLGPAARATGHGGQRHAADAEGRIV